MIFTLLTCTSSSDSYKPIQTSANHFLIVRQRDDNRGLDPSINCNYRNSLKNDNIKNIFIDQGKSERNSYALTRSRLPMSSNIEEKNSIEIVIQVFNIDVPYVWEETERKSSDTINEAFIDV